MLLRALQQPSVAIGNLLGAQLTHDAARHAPGHHGAEHQGQRQGGEHHAQKAGGLIHGMLVGALDAHFLEVDELVDRCQPLHILGLGLRPQGLRCGAVASLHLGHDGLRAGHGLGLGAADVGIQLGQFRGGIGAADQLFQGRGRLGIEIGQRRNGGDFLLTLYRGGAEHHVAYRDGAVVCRTTEVDGIALHLYVQIVVGAQCLIDAADLDHGHASDDHQQQQNQPEPRIQARCHGHTCEKHGELR